MPTSSASRGAQRVRLSLPRRPPPKLRRRRSHIQWPSPVASRGGRTNVSRSLFLIGLYSAAIVLFVTLLFPRVSAVLFHREIAWASGVHEAALTTVILVFVGVSVALLMQLIGALLLDSILLLPAIISSFTARSTRGFFLQACIIGAFCSIAGFFTSFALDVPASSAVTVIAACLLGAGLIYRRFSRRIA